MSRGVLFLNLLKDIHSLLFKDGDSKWNMDFAAGLSSGSDKAHKHRRK